MSTFSFVSAVEEELKLKFKRDKTSMEKLAATYGITDKTEVKELTELAIVNRARKIAHKDISLQEKYNGIVELYNTQVTLSHRTSLSIMLQQYSTAAPIAFLAGIFCELDKLQFKGGFGFEPSAGNGLLTIAGRPERIYVNEIDKLRNANLKTQEFNTVWNKDATEPFKGMGRFFAAVLTNPPFGTLPMPVLYDTYKITKLEHLMALRALDTMQQDGRAAIIIGGHTRWDSKGRIQAGANRIFFNYLYHKYRVADVLQLDGHKLYSRQGTAFDIRLILIDGRKVNPSGAAPLRDPEKDVVIKTFDGLYRRVMQAMETVGIVAKTAAYFTAKQLQELEVKSLELMKKWGINALGAPYMPASESCVVLHTQVPDSMAYETKSSVERIKEEVGGSMDNFVRHRLQYATRTALCKALSAEQIDAVAMAIYNIEARQQGMIIGDQTGIGKGRVAAAIIRYAVCRGLQPVFITEKANLFSDIYRDLLAIGSGHLVPFIVNGKEAKTDIKDEDGDVVYSALPLNEQQEIFKAFRVPAQYNYVVATYSQFNSPRNKPGKPMFLEAIAGGNILILDEAHNSSGASNTGEFLQNVVRQAFGVVFLSATFAKRPDNMPIYAMKTAIADCSMSKDELVEAITKGGVALQEVLSAQLVAEGQMLRRERSFEGVEVNYISLDDKAEEHKAIADSITDILREIIQFQDVFIDGMVEQLDMIAAAQGKETELREGTAKAGVDNMPYFSKIFQVINQMLFSIKAEAVADRAIMRLKEGKKPVIAFASTMGSFIETLENDYGIPVAEGDTINADFAEVLKRGLDGILRYTEKDIDGNASHKKFDLNEFPENARTEYMRILQKIKQVSTGISISPIDVVMEKIKKAGYTVAEVTGRKYELQMNTNKSKALVMPRKRINTNDAFRMFNNNEVDVLMINQSGSTGASAHAVPTAKVPASQVKQRVMIVLQAELDINTEVQKRGRINRTGQILQPIYDYMTSAIPAEKRLMMMLQKKLKSLDANTTSNQKQSTKIFDVPDFLNKYGDRVVMEYLSDNPDIDRVLDEPLKNGRENKEDEEYSLVDAANKVSGRVAVLSTKMQQEFYDDVSERYQSYTEYLQQINEYDLELEAMNLQAETKDSRVAIMGKGGESAFGEDSILETIFANVLRKPFTVPELKNLLGEATKDTDPITLQNELIAEHAVISKEELEDSLLFSQRRFDWDIEHVPLQKKIAKMKDEDKKNEAIRQRRQELEEAKKADAKLIKDRSFNNRTNMEKIFKFFYSGRMIQYPVKTYAYGEAELANAVFIGYHIDKKKKRPYLPSLVKLRFAIASSMKYICVPASNMETMLSIIGASADVVQPSKDKFSAVWEQYITERLVDRNTRYTVTGNLLQAYGTYQGKLVSYTTLDGKTVKGILMPEYWKPDDKNGDTMVVPVSNAYAVINSLVHDKAIDTNNGLSFVRKGVDFKLIVGASKAKGGDIYLDNKLLELVEKNMFEKSADKMIATLPQKNLKRFLEILQANHGSTMTINSEQYELIGERKTAGKRRKIELPPPEPEPETPKRLSPARVRWLELEAMALALTPFEF